MTDTAILWPVLVQVALTFFLLFWMGKLRVDAYRAGDYVKSSEGVRPVWKGRAGTISNAFHNQLETPILFYAVVAFSVIAGAVDDVMLALAWGYAVLRIVHALIFATYNYVPHRFSVFVVSSVVLLAMWVKFAAHII